MCYSVEYDSTLYRSESEHPTDVYPEICADPRLSLSSAPRFADPRFADSRASQFRTGNGGDSKLET